MADESDRGLFHLNTHIHTHKYTIKISAVR